MDPDEKLDLMASDVLKQREKRAEFSRKKGGNDVDKDLDYINDRNRVYNKKLERNFGNTTAQTKANLERGSAI